MFYFTFIYLFTSVFLLVKERKNLAVRYLINIMTSYLIALYAMMIYLSKDTYYYNTVNSLFSLPESMWKMMMFLKLSQSFLLSVMNLASLFVLYLGFCFSMHFYLKESTQKSKTIRHIIAAVLLIEYIFYLPPAEKELYLLLYPNILSVKEYNLIKICMHYATTIFNIAIVIASIVILCISLFKSSALRTIKLQILEIGLSYALIMLSYLFIFGNLPANLINVSKISGTISYKSIPLITSPLLHKIFPYYLISTFLIFVLLIYRYATINNRIHQQTFSLSKEIAASDTTSKVFCHYMKNELLAIQAEVETLTPKSDDEDIYNDIISRCNNLYNRLDVIHRSTKSSELILTETNLSNFMKQVISNSSAQFKDVGVNFDSEAPDAMVMMDQNYFEQAINNLFTNALDAVSNLADREAEITVYISISNQWAVIMIKDNGIGIPKEDLHKIFEPFYSSAPISKHWGVGLSLTHKIVAAHEGYIEVDSKLNEGTTFKVMLPLLM